MIEGESFVVVGVAREALKVTHDKRNTLCVFTLLCVSVCVTSECSDFQLCLRSCTFTQALSLTVYTGQVATFAG